MFSTEIYFGASLVKGIYQQYLKALG